ncbi:PadR family transcriptional regulator [Solibacillus sp. CAU 1738]|uniref:PadR family transcriptional regulator n=1 Tax=Solibacillus sp. CAU 1738 TaxID=3140363 RepID=UPI0032610D83
MDDRLKNLRKSIEKTTFKNLQFSDAHRQLVHKKIEQLQSEEENVKLSILQLLKEEKTGYELTQLLHARGMKHIANNEGQVYTLLHELELSQTIQGRWTLDGNKYYQLMEKGFKVLQNEKKTHSKKQIPFSKLREDFR